MSKSCKHKWTTVPHWMWALMGMTRTGAWYAGRPVEPWCVKCGAAGTYTEIKRMERRSKFKLYAIVGTPIAAVVFSLSYMFGQGLGGGLGSFGIGLLIVAVCAGYAALAVD